MNHLPVRYSWGSQLHKMVQTHPLEPFDMAVILRRFYWILLLGKFQVIHIGYEPVCPRKVICLGNLTETGILMFL